MFIILIWRVKIYHQKKFLVNQRANYKSARKQITKCIFQVIFIIDYSKLWIINDFYWFQNLRSVSSLTFPISNFKMSVFYTSEIFIFPEDALNIRCARFPDSYNTSPIVFLPDDRASYSVKNNCRINYSLSPRFGDKTRENQYGGLLSIAILRGVASTTRWFLK